MDTVQFHLVVLSTVLIGTCADQAHAVIEVGRLAIFRGRQVLSRHMAIPIQPHQIEHRLEKSLLNAFTQDATTQQQRVD